MLKNNISPAPNPNTKGGGTPNPATERPFHSLSTTRNMQLTYVACMLLQSRKGIYTRTWQPGVNLGKAVAIFSSPLTFARTKLLPCILQCQCDLCKKNHCSQSAIEQKMRAICTEIPSWEHFPHNASWGRFGLVSCTEQ